MITDGTGMFPGNIIEATIPVLQTIDADLTILRRPLKSSDPVQSLGIFAQQWTGDPDTMELVGRNTGSEPTVARYQVPIHGLVQDMDEQRGLAIHSALAKLIRTVLYRSNALSVSLRALSVDLLGSTERLARYGISTQRFMSNEISGKWIYLSVTEFWVETETN